jgi:hypothetical protein
MTRAYLLPDHISSGFSFLLFRRSRRIFAVLRVDPTVVTSSAQHLWETNTVPSLHHRSSHTTLSKRHKPATSTAPCFPLNSCGNMDKPSDEWKSFGSMNPNSDKYKRIQHLLSSANFEYLKKRGMESRRKHQPDLSSHVQCSINSTRFASGFQNVVLELAFSDGVYWIVEPR